MVTAEGGVASLTSAVETALDEHFKALIPKPTVTAPAPPSPAFSFSAAKRSPEVVRPRAGVVESESESVSDHVVAVVPPASEEVTQAAESLPPGLPVAAPLRAPG
jgi:hypothetical protein